MFNFSVKMKFLTVFKKKIIVMENWQKSPKFTNRKIS